MRLIIILILISTTAMGQPGSLPWIPPAKGFIILNNGDTIGGKIAYTKLTENFMSQIRFTEPNGTKTTYNAGDILGIGVIGTYLVETDESVIPAYDYWDLYECRPSPKKGVMIFMNRLVGGKLRIFQNRNAVIFTSEKIDTRIDGIGFSFSSTDGLQIGPTSSIKNIEVKTSYSSYFVEKEAGKLIKVEKDNYDSLWTQLYGDCPEIDREIAKNPKLKKFSNFLILTEVYNHLCY